jgi:hypothetical protein
MAEEHGQVAAHEATPSSPAAYPAHLGETPASVAEHAAGDAAEAHGQHHAVPVMLQPPTASDQAMVALEPIITRWRYILLVLLVLVLLAALIATGPLAIDIRFGMR